MNLEKMEKIVKLYETPLYIFDIDELKQRIKFLKERLPSKIELCYAIKANTFVAKEIEERVERFEICSPGEYEICKKNNILPEKMVISGVYKTPSIIEKMIMKNKKIGRYTVESINQLTLLDELSNKYDTEINVLLRLTSGNQFGINEEDIEEIIKEREKYKKIKFKGIQYFSGTQKRTNNRLEKEINYIDTFIKKLYEKYGYIAEELEFGTGFPVHYFQGDEFDENVFLNQFSKDLGNMNFKGKIILEIGRSIVASCGYYFSKVVDAKTNKNENYAILNGGINHIVYYGQTMAMKVPFYEIIPKRSGKKEIWNLMGSLCTTNDILVKQLPVNELKIGDVFVFKNAGAYCMTEGISLFLSRELPQIGLLKNNEVKIVRNAFETYKLNMPNLENL